MILLDPDLNSDFFRRTESVIIGNMGNRRQSCRNAPRPVILVKDANHADS